jgi:multidrug resistance efflux pump
MKPNQTPTDPPPNVPDPVLSRRATAGGLLRFVYSTAVIGLGLFLIWQLVKPFIYTQSPGNVSAPLHVVSTPFTARIVELTVTPGSNVRQGDVVAKVRSPEIDGLRATLRTSVAEQINKEADLRIRLLVATNSLGAAQSRLESAQEIVDLLRMHPHDVTAVFKADALRERAMAALTLAQIEADIAETSKQIESVQRARLDIEDIKQFVDHAFNDGNQLAPINGVISGHSANPGQSVTAGTSIVEIYDPSDLHIQWVLSADRRTQPDVGAPVYVIDGARIMRGTIKQVYSISERAQTGNTVFAQPRSGQLARIELDNDEAYPAFMTDVEVRYNYWRFTDRASDILVDIMTSLGFWRAR